MSNVLTVVFDKAEQKIDSVVAAAVNELHSLGHVVKEVRVMGDSGEAKVALNTIEGILPSSVKDGVTTLVKDGEAIAKDVEDVVTNKSPDGTSPATTVVTPPESTLPTTPADVPVDTPQTAQGPVAADPTAPADTTTIESDLTIDEKRDALLKQLEDLDAEEEAQDGGTGVDPTPATTA